MRQTNQDQALTVAGQNTEIDIDDRALRSAIESSEIALHYQPQISSATGNLVGLEAFALWMHPERGLIFPDNFIGRIRTLGIFNEFDRLITDRGLSEMRHLSGKGYGTPRLSLKLSIDSLCDIGFPDTILSLAKKHGVPSENVIVEIMETDGINKLAPTLEVLTRLRMKNFQLCINDFGIGYIGIQQLRDIAPTELKINKTFVQNMLVNDGDRVMVQKIILIAHELNMKVLAEGVETQEQLEYLRLKGCDYAQGYLFSQPLPPGQMVDWLEAYRSWELQ
ncbi:MAG TPA: EAL domain-containing protein [Terracidiphilus sp.]|nr:EAL domain-containing protein [Terracidiphilus sp.]